MFQLFSPTPHHILYTPAGLPYHWLSRPLTGGVLKYGLTGEGLFQRVPERLVRSRQPARQESYMGKIIESHLIRKDSPETLLTLEEGLKLLGLKQWPEGWELWKVRIFLDALTSILKRNGETWVRFHRKVLLELLEDQIVNF